MKRAYFLVLVAALALVSYSCSLDDDQTNFQYTTLEAVGANLPDTFEFGRVYNIDVDLFRPDDCTFSETFNDSREFLDSVNVRTFAAIGIVLDNGEECMPTNDTITGSFQFEVRFTEPYLFRFYTGDDENDEPEFLEIEVPVK